MRPDASPRLVIVAPDGARTPIVVSSEPITLGRSESCDYILRNDAEVSREHADVWIDEQNRVLVADKGSKNGTRVDDGEPFRSDVRFAYRNVRIGEHEVLITGAPTPGGRDKPEVVFAHDPTVRMGDTQYFPSSRGLEISKQRLALLIQLTERIGGVFERKQLLEEAIEVCCEALGFERCLIALKTHRGDTELPVTRNVQRDETGAYKVSRTLINRAMVQGERAIVNNPATDLAGAMSESLVRFPICSALCVPILNRNEILGVIYGDRVTQATTYQPADVDFLAAIAQQAGVGLANLRLFQEYVKSQRMYAELDQARVIQKQLLPAKPLQLGCIAIEGVNEPSSAVSGDYFDYFAMEDGRLSFVIADVTGHGLPAALVMANLQSAIRVALTAQVALPVLVERINRLICQNTSSHVFVTAAVGLLDTRTADLEYVLAGHMAPIAVGAGFARPLEVADDAGGLPLGVMEDADYQSLHTKWTPEMRGLLFYTDGLTEVELADGALLGLDPLTRALAKLSEVSNAHMIRAARTVVRETLAGRPRGDDMTLLAITRA